MKQTEDKRLWESIGDCRITTVGRQHWRKRIYSYESRPRPDHGLFLVTRGSVEFATRDTSLFAREGALMLLPKGCHYKALFKGTTEDLLVNFEAEGLDASAPTLLLPNASADVLTLFDALISCEEEGRRPMRGQGLLYLLLDAISVSVKESQTPSKKLVERACFLLSRTDAPSVAEIARRCAVSESGLRHIFRQEMGMSMVAYRQGERIKEAKRLLANTDLSLTEISDQLGFYDAAYFTRTFRTQTGMTPGEYARAYRHS
ncbi:MAG: helix-turn-helix transcriptional regulator [Clostridia bacterium]|nr:helix-turn-helix transcriptional regulator [Clostridia bacterium]